MHITVYAKPNCPQCVRTRRELDILGIAYATVDLSHNEAERSRLIREGHRSAPVVETDAGAWSGYQPERIHALAREALLEPA